MIVRWRKDDKDLINNIVRKQVENVENVENVLVLDVCVCYYWAA